MSDGRGSSCCIVSRLVDIENTLVGLPSMYRTHLLELRKIHVSSFSLRLGNAFSSSPTHPTPPPHTHTQTNVGETVYSFGHMLYEMSLGHQLKSAMMDPRPPNTPESIGM